MNVARDFTADPLSIQWSALTDAAGQPSNEDACIAIEAVGATVLIVADGVGGQAQGEVASDTVVRAATEYLCRRADVHDSPAKLLTAAFEFAQDALRTVIVNSPMARSMRSTLLIAMATRSSLWVAHVGDSRAYLIRGGTVTQLTRDDTIVQTLMDLGQLDRGAARRHSKRNVLLQSLGDPKDLDIHVSESLAPEEGDVLVVCSDGPPDVLDDSEFAACAGTGTSAQMAAALMAAALERHAPDNVSVGVLVWRKSQKRLSVAASGHGQPIARPRDHFRAVAVVLLLVLAALVAAGIVRRTTRRFGSAAAAAHAMVPATSQVTLACKTLP
ncbi:MAG: protein phosphatase 2C domain-containing protein [Deltaproteobacteria bacterium]